MSAERPEVGGLWKPAPCAERKAGERREEP